LGARSVGKTGASGSSPGFAAMPSTVEYRRRTLGFQLLLITAAGPVRHRGLRRPLCSG
jgi:hypothetical protein